ncbi:MAG: hypothetical protein S4CHLAM6_12460 [Chlamydiae bacterium]|nr:hypothetical protein [Chlamydiota bacterium]
MSVVSIQQPRVVNFLQTLNESIKSKAFQISFGTTFAFTAMLIIYQSHACLNAQPKNLNNNAALQNPLLVNQLPIIGLASPVSAAYDYCMRNQSLESKNFSIKPLAEISPFNPPLVGEILAHKFEQASAEKIDQKITAQCKRQAYYSADLLHKKNKFSRPANSSAPRVVQVSKNVYPIPNAIWSKWIWRAGGVVAAGVFTQKVVKPFASSAMLSLGRLMLDLFLF